MVEENTKCCQNCKFYDERTGFCRYNPPAIIMSYVNRMTFPNAVFPKISMPALDWCSKFEDVE